MQKRYFMYNTSIETKNTRKGIKMKNVTVKKTTKGEYLAMVHTDTVFGVTAFRIINNSYGTSRQWTLTTLDGKELNSWTTKKSMVDYLATRSNEQILNMIEQ